MARRVSEARGGMRASATLVLLAGLVAALAMAPIAYLLLRSIEIGPAVPELLRRARALRILGNTALLAGAVTATAVPLGLVLAWLTVQTDLPGRRFWGVVTILPIAMPSYLGAFALIGAFGPRGMLQSWLGPLGVERLPSVYGFPGAWVVLTLFTYPYVQLSVRAALRGLDPSIEDAARTLGRTGYETFRQVTLPQLRPALQAGALLVALYTLSDFGAVSMLQFPSFTRAIYVQYTAALDRNAAALLALLLVLLSGMVLHMEVRFRGRFPHRSGVGTPRPPARARLGRWRIPAIGLVLAVTLLALGAPIAVVGYWLVRGVRAGETVAPQGRVLVQSLLVSAQAGGAAVLAGLPVVLLAVRHPGPLSRLFERCTWLAHAVPGIAVALALAFFGIRAVPFLYQGMAMLIFAYVVLFLPLAIGCLRASLLQVTPRMEEAARMLGRTPRRALVSVTLPLIRPGILAGFALVFLHALKELPATLLLGPTGFHTLATRIWGAVEEAFFARAAAPALVLMLASALSMGLMFGREEALIDP